jgi:sugar phosphate isomerase/epimerase
MKTYDKLSRRDWLKLAGAATVAAPWPGWAEEDLQAKAKKNLKLAVFSGVYSALPLEEAAKRIKADGFAGVVLEYAFADARLDPAQPDWEVVRRVTSCLERQGLQIAGLYGYYNVVAPDLEARQKGARRMRFLIDNWRRLGSPLISTETGTFNRQSEWNDAPENATEEAYLECRAAFLSLAVQAEKQGATVTIEPYWKNIINSAERAERLFREVPSAGLKLVMDPCNYFRKYELAQMGPMLDDLFQRVGKQTAVAHAKDVKGSASADDTDLPAAGRGVLDYPRYLRHLARLDRELFLVVEHLSLAEVPAVRDFVLKQFDKI